MTDPIKVESFFSASEHELNFFSSKEENTTSNTSSRRQSLYLSVHNNDKDETLSEDCDNGRKINNLNFEEYLPSDYISDSFSEHSRIKQTSNYYNDYEQESRGVLNINEPIDYFVSDNYARKFADSH